MPTPIAGFEIRIFRAAKHCIVDFFGIFVDGNAIRHVIAESVKIDDAFAQNFLVVLVVHEGGINSHVAIKFFGEVGISSANLHVAAKVVKQTVFALSFKHVFGIGRQRITRHVTNHVADFEIRIDFVTGDDCLCRRDELIVQSLDTLLRHVFKFAEFARFIAL